MSPHKVVEKMPRLVELYDMPGLEGYDEFVALRGELLDALRGWAPTTFYVGDEQRIVIYRGDEFAIYSRNVSVSRHTLRLALSTDTPEKERAAAITQLLFAVGRP